MSERGVREQRPERGGMVRSGFKNLRLSLAGRDRNDFRAEIAEPAENPELSVRFAAALARRETMRSTDTSSPEPSSCLYLWIAWSPAWPADGRPRRSVSSSLRPPRSPREILCVPDESD